VRYTRSTFLVGLVAAAIWCPQVTAQNLLTDGGFEDPSKFTSDGAPFVGFWEAFNGGAGSFSVNDTLSPRTGARDAHPGITASNNNFAGLFQDVPVIAGDSYTYSGWHKSVNSNPAEYVTEARFEWRNSVSNTEISRNQILPIAGLQYTQFSLTLPVPAGADTARVVYAIQTFSDTGTVNTGDVFLDDFSVTRVPEPSTFVLAGLGGLALLWKRRKS
jgi:hypothetical protein